MDGNGRWATGRGLSRVDGHKAGVKAIRPVIEELDRQGVHIVTLYAFSTENWQRPSDEVGALMGLFEQTIILELDEMHRNGIQIRLIGRREDLSDTLRNLVTDAEKVTANNQKAILNVAINYGGRKELVWAIRELAGAGSDLAKVEEEQISAALYTAGLPDPDLIIRTAGEMRTSNFLLWQAAYAELYVTDVLWPDFGATDVGLALDEYRKRTRKFGAVVPS
jgi:undecaprenyl diphosphate synthase